MHSVTARFAGTVLVGAAMLCLVSIQNRSAMARQPATPNASVIPLTVDFGGAAPARPFPVRGGLPFARGELIDLATLRLLADGAEADCQVAVAAVWPDGSVKWARIDFFAQPGQQYAAEFGLTKRAAVADAVKVARDGERSVTVDTGPLVATVGRDGSGLLDRVLFGGQEVVAPGADRRNIVDFIHVRDTSAYPAMSRVVDGTLDPSKLTITTLDVEEAGPLHAVVLLRGRYEYQTVGSTFPPEVARRGFCPFTVRLHFYRGGGMVGVEHFWAYEGEADHDFVRQVALSLPASCAADGSIVTYAGDGGSHECPSEFSSLYQESADDYRLLAGRSAAGPLAQVAAGRRAPGWVDVSSSEGGLAVGVRWFWEQHAKSLRVDLKAGRIAACLWAPEARPLDYRRYTRIRAVGEAAIGQAKGTGKVHELLLYFHGPGAAVGDISQLYAAFEARPLVLAPVDRYADTRVLGYYHARQAGKFAELEDAITRPIDYWKFCQERFRWYGYFDYGDVQSFYNHYNTQNRWANDYGRWGWAGGDQQGRLNYALLLQFLRTADRSEFELAEANVRHVHSVDGVHTDEYEWDGKWQNLRGTVHRHNAQHWAGGYTPARGAHPVGAKIYYYLTGDEWARDMLDEVLALAVRGGASELEGPAMQSFICAWERTGDTKYRDLLLKAIEDSGIAKQQGGWNTMMAAAFGMTDALVEYMDLTGDTRFVPTVREFAVNCTEPSVTSSWTWPGGYFRIYGAALRLTGDKQWSDTLRGALDKWLVGMHQCGAFLPREEWPGRYESTVGWGYYAGPVPGVGTDANTLRDLPFAMEAIAAFESSNGDAK